ncbi:unnamed protein product [Adineta ricciae]|uniref:DUF7910 domain-containing protein n=1 Tax=Adineta ricciae TaxID=249248 RepID=A0A815MFM6_ADIRI|nr:unnamed protein product [Adineta ricciae]CAF1421894.1 unnamed protein product [Adineta ricciae]
MSQKHHHHGSFSGNHAITYTLYIPSPVAATNLLPLAVIIHGKKHNVREMLDDYKDFSRENHCALFLPYFPDDYRYNMMIDEGDPSFRSDLVLLQMLDEMKSAHQHVDTSKFLLHGFSAGGQFVHRFAYLHASRILGLSIGAPGGITLIDFQSDWHTGIANLEAVSNGGNFDMETMKVLPIQICIGDSDFDRDRLGKAKQLRDNYKHVGIQHVQYDLVKHAAHDSSKMRNVVSEFFRDVLSNVHQTAHNEIASGPSERAHSVIALRSNANGKFVCAENGGKGSLIANRDSASGWETFDMIDLGGGHVALKSHANGRYVCAENGGNGSLVASSKKIDAWETFIIVDRGHGKVAFRAVNRKYVCADNHGHSELKADRDKADKWETFDVVPK